MLNQKWLLSNLASVLLVDLLGYDGMCVVSVSGGTTSCCLGGCYGSPNSDRGIEVLRIR